MRSSQDLTAKFNLTGCLEYLTEFALCDIKMASREGHRPGAIASIHILSS